MAISSLQTLMSQKSAAGTPWTTEEAKTELLKLAMESKLSDASGSVEEDGKQYARKDGAWVEVVAGAAAPTALTPSANVKFGPAAGAGITDVLPAAPAAGDRAKYYIKPTGDKTLDFDAAILKPTDSGLTLPKTMTSGKTYIVLMEFNGTAWLLVSLVGGY